MHNQKNTNMISRKDIHNGEIRDHIIHIGHEFGEGFEFLKQYPKSVTIFGSSLMPKDSSYYAKAEALASRIVKTLKYTIITGGGPGIMEAANKGALESGGESVGLNVSLPHESSPNSYLNHSIKFSYFFSRKVMLTFAAEAYIFFPGGFGTCDELFSILTLIQTGKIPRVPIILFGVEYWKPFSEFLKTVMSDKFKTISPEDMNLFEITDSEDRILEIITQAPFSEWWRKIN